MDLTNKERRLIRNYETRLRYASSKEEIFFCHSQIKAILQKVKDRMDK